MKEREVVDGGGEIAVLAVKVECGEVRVASIGSGGNPPASETGQARGRGGKCNGVKGQIGGGRSARDCRNGMVKELPTALRKEEAEDSPATESRGEDGNGRGG